MIGDTMETDIRGAVEAGMLSYLVLSGSTQFEDIGDHVYQPTCVLQSVADLVDEILTGKVLQHVSRSRNRQQKFPRQTRPAASDRRFRLA
jgi:hypothetical protein